jgi:hypothetical protein
MPEIATAGEDAVHVLIERDSLRDGEAQVFLMLVARKTEEDLVILDVKDWNGCAPTPVLRRARCGDKLRNRSRKL